MLDPAHDDTRSEDDKTEPGRTVKIEQLLLSGLDHYFRGRYEHAIDVWTRVLFLDRSHARARAYIDRARAALAEGLRESEELVHTGLEAFNRGDAVEARSLLTSAVQRGGGRDEALTVLDRLDRLEGASGDDVISRRGGRRDLSDRRSNHRSNLAPVRRVRVLPLVFLVAVFAGASYLAVSWSEWRPVILGSANRPVSLSQVLAEPLPLPSGTELSLARAHRLVADQRLHEALSVLRTIGAGDPLSGEAQVLTTRIQKQLLARVGPAVNDDDTSVGEVDASR